MNTVAEDAVIVASPPAKSFSRPEDRTAGAVQVHQPAGNATSLLVAIERATSNPAMDIDKMERLFVMHQKVVAQEAEAAFNDAMARAQSEIQPIVTNAENSHTKSRYAKLAAIDKEITPIHTKYGISISYDTETKNDADPIPQGMVRTVAIVSHAGGHSRKHHIDLPPDAAGSQGNANKTMVQALGSTNAYGRRYLKLMIFNVSTFDDNDGNAPGNKGGMDEKTLADHIAKMDECADLPALQKTFGVAWKAAEKLNDKSAMGTLTRSKDARKAALTKKGGAK